MNTRLKEALRKERAQAKMYHYASSSVFSNKELGLTAKEIYLLEEKLEILKSYVQIIEEQLVLIGDTL